MARRDRRRREAGAFAVSLLLHLAALTMLARVAIPAFYAPAPTFELQLTPPPLATPTAQRSRPAASRAHLAQTAERAPVLRPRAREPQRAIQAPPRPVPPRAQPAPPSAPSHSSASVPSAAGPSGSSSSGVAGTGRWRVEGGDDGQDGVRRFLRATVGCAHEDYVRLTAAERASCDRRMAQDARSLGIAPDKLGAFIAAAQAQERARANRTGPLSQPLTPCEGASNLSSSCLTPPPRPQE